MQNYDRALQREQQPQQRTNAPPFAPYTRRSAPNLDISPGSPPVTSDYASSRQLRDVLPLPTPLKNQPTTSEIVPYLPKPSLEPLQPPSSPLQSSKPQKFSSFGGDVGVRPGLFALEKSLVDTALKAGYLKPLQQESKGDREIREFYRKVGRKIRDGINGLGDAINHPKDTFDNVFDRLADPFKRHPRTDPKNDDSRQRTRYAYEIRAFTFYSPNNRIQQQAASAGGEYSLGEIGYNNPNFSYSPGNTARLHQAIYWDQISGNAPNFTVSHASSQCEPDTIRPDPTYVPPSSDSPLLTQPDGTTPDISAYPPIFTEDDFKPQRKTNDDRAKQDEQDRQRQPDPEQQRQTDDHADKLPAPYPWDDLFPDFKPFPAPFPYPLDPLSETDSPDKTNSDRLGDTLQRVKDFIDNLSPAPHEEPRTETTINGEPVNTRQPSPSPITRPTDTPGTNVTINGEPVPRLNPPLPDTRVNSPTTVKAPTENIVKPDTGISPKTQAQTESQPKTPGKCEDPCIQGLHDKADAKAGKDLKVKIFKSCSKPVPEGQTTKPSEIDFEEKTIKVPGDELDAYKFLYDRLYALECEQCGDPKAIASVPEWWQARRGADIPQLAIIFAEQFDSGKLGDSRWTLSIPHYNKPKGARPNIPTYKKGNWFGTLRLTDGSKLGVNAGSSSECKRVLNRLKIHIPVEFRTKKGKAIKPRIVEDPNAAFKECKVTPVRADFYSKGQTNLQPDWSINLRQKVK